MIGVSGQEILLLALVLGLPALVVAIVLVANKSRRKRKTQDDDISDGW